MGDGDANKIAYHLPAMGGLTVGASFADSGEVGSTDTTSFGARYAMDAGGNAITLGFATQTTEATTTDTDSQNLGMKIVSGDISFAVARLKRDDWKSVREETRSENEKQAKVGLG
jgi:predicted porin